MYHTNVFLVSGQNFFLLSLRFSAERDSVKDYLKEKQSIELQIISSRRVRGGAGKTLSLLPHSDTTLMKNAITIAL